MNPAQLWSMDRKGRSNLLVYTNQTKVLRAHMRSKKVRGLMKSGFLYLMVRVNGVATYPWNCINGKYYRGELRKRIRSLLRSS